jgi:hypothetical protein
MHRDDVIRGQFRHGLGQIDQGGDVAEGIHIRLLRGKKAGGGCQLDWGGQGGGGPLGLWEGWAIASEVAWAGGALEPEGAGSTGGVWGKGYQGEQLSALRGKGGGVVKWQGVPSVDGSNMHQIGNIPRNVHLVPWRGPGLPGPLAKDLARMQQHVKHAASVGVLRRRNGFLFHGRGCSKGSRGGFGLLRGHSLEPETDLG